MTKTTRTGPDRDRTTYAGITAVALAAAVMSFAGWSGLAVLAGYTGQWTVPVLGVTVQQSWLLPVCVDAYALVATRVWLHSQTASEQTVAYARRNAIGAIVLSIGGNGVFHGLAASGPVYMVVVSVVVGAIAPLVFGLVVHLAVQWGDDRRRAQEKADRSVAIQREPKRSTEPVQSDRSEAKPDQKPGQKPDRLAPVRSITTGSDDDAMETLRSDFPDQLPGLNEVVRSTGVGKTRARRLLNRLTAERTAGETDENLEAAQ